MKAPKAAALVRKIYETWPYPAADGRALMQSRWRLAPMEWLQTLWKPGREKTAPERILIAGCGTGNEAFLIRRRFPQAEIVGVDFSPRSIAIAKKLQQRRPETGSIRFLAADLASRGFSRHVGRDFDFVSCHGVLSYVPEPERVLQNLAQCLEADGALYLGVNGAQHFSAPLRQALPEFGFDMTELRDGPYLRQILQLWDLLRGQKGSDQLAERDASYLAGDLFGPVILNLPLADWVSMARDAGLHFQGSFSHWRALRPALEKDVSGVLLPRSRAEVCKVMDILCPAEFHRLLFTRQSKPHPPWEKPAAVLGWHPALTDLYTIRLPQRSRSPQSSRRLTFTSVAADTRLDWQMPEWEVEILRRSDGRQCLGEILKRIPGAPPADLLQQQLYLLHQLLVIDLLPGRRSAPSR